MRGATAGKVRREKEAHPERFCPVRGCLWRTVTNAGPKPCRNHPTRNPPVVEEPEAEDGPDWCGECGAVVAPKDDEGNYLYPEGRPGREYGVCGWCAPGQGHRV